MRPDDDDQIISRRDIVLKDANRFAEQAFDTVSADGGADAAGDAQAPAASLQAVGLGIDDQGPAGLLSAGGVNGRERPAAAETKAAAEPVRFGGQCDPVSASQRSASSAALQPIPAAVTACL